ncbi:MAG: DNA-binding transcriptional regulator Fis [Pseudomonadota bacterium]
MNSIVDTMEATMTAPITQAQQPLRNSVRDSLNHYFGQLGDTIINNLYEMVLAEVEAPLLELVIQYTKGNQSKAAILLGLSRGTLRKKLKIYGLLD